MEEWQEAARTVERCFELRRCSSSLDKDEEDNKHMSYRESASTACSEPEEDTEREMDSEEKVDKKPVKVLPCPRCHSLNTKFCYFNNYNVNQPRHFCKNCQRYWTAGGAMRNVPVGAGRRKNKLLSSQCRQVVVPPNAVTATKAKTLTSAASDNNLDEVGIPSTSKLVKGLGEAMCESMAAVLNLEDHKRSDGISSIDGNCEEPSSSGSSSTANVCKENELVKIKIEEAGLQGHYNGFTPMHPLQFYAGSPFAYPCNPSSHTVGFGPNASNINPSQIGPLPVFAVPGFCATSISIPWVHASYWGCLPNWNVPLVRPIGCHFPSSSSNSSGSSGNISPTLGKHSRDENLRAEEKAEHPLWVPKTLRIDDPNEAAKSTIWATLGIEPGESKSLARGGMSKAFQQPKSDTSCNTSDTDKVLQANPAAFSRSQSFQENA